MRFFTQALIFAMMIFSFPTSGQRRLATDNYEIALDQMQLSNFDSALYHLNRSIVIQRDPNVFYTRGVLYDQIGEELRAIDDFSSSIALKPLFV